MNKKKITRTLFKREIVTEVTIMDFGINILIGGGDLSHVGAISLCGIDGEIHTVTLNEHKESYITKKWVEEIYRITLEPVCVEAGIHYNHADKEQIRTILQITDEILEEIKKYLSKSKSQCNY